MSRTLAILSLLLLLAPPARGEGAATASAAAGTLHASLSPALAPPAAAAAPPSRDARERLLFERAMVEVTAGLPELVVTSTFRTPEDQERIRRQGYRPQPNSQHLHGLAWDLAAPPEVLDVLEERAHAHGLVPLRMRSPVSGVEYLHVQRYGRLPARLREALVARAAARPVTPALYTRDAADTALAAFGVPGVDEFAASLESEGPLAALALPAPPVVPRPLADARLELPRQLLRRPAQGEIVLLVRLSPEGAVQAVDVESSDLPDFEEAVTSQVEQWRFTPPLHRGRPIAVTARLPIPIQVR